MAALTVGLPAETKPGERRVALTDDAVAELGEHGVTVLVESGAGEAAGIDDGRYYLAGAEICDRDDAWGADLVVKVKEPQRDELGLLRDDQVLFSYLHLAAYPGVAAALSASGTCAIAFETVERGGRLPLLAPMSEIAGKVAGQSIASLLQSHQGGSGVLLGGATGVAPARVVVVGAGVAGRNAARIALGLGAQVVVMDRDVDRLAEVERELSGRLVCRASNQMAVAEEVQGADAVVGAVLVAGDSAPKVITEEMVELMPPGSVVVDLAIDQGGCVATSEETSWDSPVRVVHDVLHFAVGNVPAAVPRTATEALSAALLPYVSALATTGVVPALRGIDGFSKGLNLWQGEVCHEAVARALGRPTMAWETLW